MDQYPNLSAAEPQQAVQNATGQRPRQPDLPLDTPRAGQGPHQYVQYAGQQQQPPQQAVAEPFQASPKTQDVRVQCEAKDCEALLQVMISIMPALSARAEHTIYDCCGQPMASLKPSLSLLLCSAGQHTDHTASAIPSHRPLWWL